MAIQEIKSQYRMTTESVLESVQGHVWLFHNKYSTRSYR